MIVTRYWLFFAAVALLAGFNVFWHLSSTAILSLDEARYGVAAGEMLNAHRFLVPTYAGRAEYWNLKPPLGYWLIEASYGLFGRSAWALRLPSALSGLATVLVTMAFCRQLLGRRAAILAGLFVATCDGLLSYHGARNGDLDAELTLLMTVGLTLVPRLNRSDGWRMAWALVLALGFLLKSFAVIPFLIAAAIEQQFLARAPMGWRRWGSALATFCLIVGSWAALRWLNDGTPYFLERMLSEDLFQRSISNIDGGSTISWSYIAGLFDRFAPWPLLIIAGCWQFRAVRGSPRRKAAIRLLTLWACVPLCLFSMARTHHHWYMDPLYPALAMLAALAALLIMRRMSTGVVVCCMVLALIACEVRLLTGIYLHDRRPQAQQFLASLRPHGPRGSSRLATTFRLAYSERFILQVVDGFAVSEPGDLILTANTSRTPELILDSRQDGFASLHRTAHPDILARSAEFVLYAPSSPVLIAQRGYDEE